MRSVWVARWHRPRVGLNAAVAKVVGKVGRESGEAKRVVLDAKVEAFDIPGQISLAELRERSLDAARGGRPFCFAP